MLLDLRVEKRFGSSAKAAATTSASDRNESGAEENTISANSTIDVATVAREGNLSIPEASGDSIQDNQAGMVQHSADNLAQDRSRHPDQVIPSIEAVGKGAPSSEAGQTTEPAAESKDADVGSNVGDPAPLERVLPRRPSLRRT
jgi:hypothetical protein